LRYYGDDSGAADWYRKAAEQGSQTGQRWLGNLYATGKGVPQDYVQAHMWYNLAGVQGEEKASDLRDKIANEMTPAQIYEAQRLAREWEAQHQQ